jgi:hypothetical protein
MPIDHRSHCCCSIAVHVNAVVVEAVVARVAVSLQHGEMYDCSNSSYSSAVLLLFSLTAATYLTAVVTVYK